eukprot:2987710-Prymnesium_polylepis.1
MGGWGTGWSCSPSHAHVQIRIEGQRAHGMLCVTAIATGGALVPCRGPFGPWAHHVCMQHGLGGTRSRNADLATPSVGSGSQLLCTERRHGRLPTRLPRPAMLQSRVHMFVTSERSDIVVYVRCVR